MISPRHALLVLVVALAACDGNRDKVEDASPATPASSPAEGTAAAAVPAAEFLTTLKLPFPHKITSSREVARKGGGAAQVFSIDYTEGRVKTIDQQLAAALADVGMERESRAQVPGGVRVAYTADDGRKVSTMIRNKKYFKSRIADDSAGQISLTYVPR